MYMCRYVYVLYGSAEQLYCYKHMYICKYVCIHTHMYIQQFLITCRVLLQIM